MFVAKVLRVGPGVERSDRNDEAETVSRRYFTAAPRLYERNAILCGDQAGVRIGQGFVSDEVLIHPGQPRPPQGWNIIADQRFQADIAGFGYQHGAEAGCKIADSRFALAYMREFRCELSTSGDLKQNFRQIHPWEPRVHGLAKANQTWRIVQLVKAGQDQFVLAVRSLNSCSRLLGRLAATAR